MRRAMRGRVVLVTGASRGIGRRVAERLGRLGARVAVTARSADELARLTQTLKDVGTEVEAYPADLTDSAARDGLIRDVVARFGGLDVLVNCAGVASFGEFASSEEGILRRVMEINFFVPAEMIRLAFPHLLQ